MHGDYGEVSCDVTGNTYSSVLTVQVVSAGVAISACPQAGELLLGTREGVHLNSGPGPKAPSQHNLVLLFYGTCRPENKDDIISI